EAINRAWNRCEGAWRSFQGTTDILPESDAGTTVTRERWLLILFQELGYGRLLTSKAQHINGKSYPISHAWHHTPIHLISLRQDLDRRTPGVAGAARMSPHSMVQEFLNRSDDHLWGVVSNGLMLRLLRDNFSLTRQAYVEFDLQAMMSGEVYSDFILLYMILHQSRVEAEKPEQCWLERWTQEAQRRGTRALDQLRKGVQQAIQTLGQGFLAHPTNSTLRQKLQSGVLTPHGLYEQLLRLVYRLIFLFVAEDRDLLLGTDTPPEARSRYIDHYSLTRIRRIAGRLRGARHGDLWQGLRITFQCLIDGQPAFGLSPLGGFLFSADALADLNDCDLSNDALLTAVRHLSFTQDRRMLRPVDYRNLGTEELGSVYESLLELHAEVNVSASTFELRVAAGSERKTTGSYYTPSSLIRCLLDSALEPVIAGKLKEPDPEKALLDLKVVDPACGSGHFLIAAAHRIGKHLAIIRTGEIEPPPEQRRKALRDVVSHCIYGVDVNPLAVELCKVALWIETLDPGRPLGFLDHRIKCGNSLIGATPELLKKGIPDDAFKPVEGDDKKIASGIRKKNKRERRGQHDLFAGVTAAPDWQEAVEGFQEWGSMPENAFQQVCEKAAQYETLRDKLTYRHEREVADLWAAAFFWPLTEVSASTVPTEDIFRRVQGDDLELTEEIRKRMEELVSSHRFFHWHLEFPEVFTTPSDHTFPPLAGGTHHETFPPLAGGIEGGGGFDCVLGNPPWERIKLQEKEFFAQKDPEIAGAPNAATRKRLISKLPETNPALWKAFQDAKRSSECES
ncbi:MAG: N-6 DNA methylase, partial [Desulfobacterales bacterium]|nr:N-6 DNA methylase [Desulfobacterales bacterium]